MKVLKFSLLACFILAAIFGALGCATLSTKLAGSGDTGQAAPTNGLPNVGQDLKQPTSSIFEFLPNRIASEFSHDLGYSNVDSFLSKATYRSDWIDYGSPLSDSAYCIYRLELLETLTDVKLDLDWDGTAPAECWVALANWDTLSWDWHFAGALSSLDILDPAPYRDEANRCFAAVVVLSRFPVVLVEIGFSGQGGGDGYTLFAPLKSTETFLIDMDGTTVHSWESAYLPGNSVELTEDGFLLRTCTLSNPDFGSGGTGGRIEKLDWDSNVVWSYELSTPDACQHHDFELLPSGNILLVVWQKYSEAEAIDAGRDPLALSDGELWADSIIEIEPVGESGGNVVWEWYLWDHLVQDYDPAQDNYGVVADNPGLVDLNFGNQRADWTHVNSIDYREAIDHIAISVNSLSELWVIDHSTTTAEAASHTGGNAGQGGDLLYRWGNPQAYQAGSIADKVFYGQHDVQWIREGLRGSGNLLMYVNGQNRPQGEYSSVAEIFPPFWLGSSYPKTADNWGPSNMTWEYTSDPPTDFYSRVISGVQRLPGGNTLICCGTPGWFFEVDRYGIIQWEYTNIVGPGPGGAPVFRCTRYSPEYPGLAGLTL